LDVEERETQLKRFIEQRIGESHARFGEKGYGPSQHTAMLKEIDELMSAWAKVKAALKGEK